MHEQSKGYINFRSYEDLTAYSKGKKSKLQKLIEYWNETDSVKGKEK